ncbi:ANTAR domain-containing protein [Streptomyces sp. NPDC046759]|uniref:ANTAR domain-containing protein n=1 Tax=Streptomyces sp. NPDC046759 TaxID=3155019 RepID=UPI0033D972B2
MTTGEATVTVQPVAERAVVLRLTGTLDALGAGVLGRELDLRLRRADERGLRLVLDVSGVREVSSTAVQTLDAHTRYRAVGPVLVTGATPQVRRVLTTTSLPGIRLYASLECALATVCACENQGGGDWPHAAEGTPAEIFGLRAKARTSGTIGVAQGILIARYSLSGPADAFALLRAASQQHNVPLRVVASAVVTAPAPAGEQWFPGRRHTPSPVLELPQADRVDVRDRRQVLRAALYAAVTLADADAAEIHLTDQVQDEALVLEAHHGLDAAYRDCLALVVGPPAVCARAQAGGRPVTVPDVAADPELAGHPVGRAALGVGSRALYGVPMTTDTGDSTGVVTLHRTDPGAWLGPGEEDDLERLAHELAGWWSWYRRTIVQDALEHLHAQGAAGG